MHQFICFMRHRTETVYHTFAVSLYLLIALQTVQFTIKEHTLAVAWHISLREIHLQIALYATVVNEIITRKLGAFIHLLLIKVTELLVLQLSDSLRENLLVGFITEIFHKTALLRAQQITRTTDIQVLHGEIEAAAQFTERFQSLQTATCLRGKCALRWRHQIAESLLVASSYASTHLMQVTQSEVMSIAHDNRIGIGNIDAVLYDGGRKQYIIIIIDKAHDDFLQILRLHLSVTDCYPTVWNMLLDEHLELRKLGYSVAYEINLSVSAHLEVDGIADNFTTKRYQFGMNRITVRWRSAHDTHIPGAHQRELEGTRNRSGTHRKCVDIHLELTEFLFGRHTELLLFIDDEQSQVMPFHGLGYQLMCTYQDVYLTLFQVFKHLSGFLRRACPAEVIYPYRHAFQTLFKCLIVLESQNGSRHQHRNLLAVARSLEGCTDGNLSLAEAHIATNQTVHRSAALHILLYLLGSLILVWRIFIEEGSLQRMLQIIVGTEGESLLPSALGIEFDQVARNVLDSLLSFVLEFIPGTCTQCRQARRSTGIAAAIFADFIKRVDRNIHLVIVRIDDSDHFLIAVARRNPYQTAELADTEVYMHDKIAYFHLLQFLHGECHLARSRLI